MGEVRVEILQSHIRSIDQKLSLLSAKLDGLEVYVGRVLSAFEDRMSQDMRDALGETSRDLNERLDRIEQALRTKP